MCGRFRLARSKEILDEYFGIVEDDEVEWEAHYNIAPTQLVPVVRERRLSLLFWGTRPSLINVRAESAARLPAFKTQRCLIPADGFYEWQKVGKQKQPYCFEVGDGKLFAFAGLWQGKTCSILTTAPNALTAKVHDRMPAIVDPADYAAWLDPRSTEVSDFLQPYAGEMRSYTVSTRVNNAKNDDAECSRAVEPIGEPIPAQRSLFGDHA